MPGIGALPRYCCFTAKGLRPRHNLLQLRKDIRHRTTEAGEDKSGHINAGPNEGIFFLDSEPSYIYLYHP